MRAHTKLTAIVAAGFVAAGSVTGCASHGRIASVASSFLPLSSAPMPSTSPPQAPSTTAASSGPDSASPAAVSPSDDNNDFSSPTPCPVSAPQKFVEGKSAKKDADGNIVFTYRTAQRLCGGPDDEQFATTGKQDLHATVKASALVLMLPPDGTTQALQIPVAALPDAMAANNQAPYYAITFDSAGSISRIEQYFHP